MNKVYILEHVYEINEIDEIKFIGVFSSIEIANEVVNRLYLITGFKDYPKDSFQISEHIINASSWDEGFIKWEDAL